MTATFIKSGFHAVNLTLNTCKGLFFFFKAETKKSELNSLLSIRKKSRHLQFSCHTTVVRYLPWQLQAPNAGNFKHNLLWQHMYVTFLWTVTSMSYMSTMDPWDIFKLRYLLFRRNIFFSNNLAIFLLKYFYKSLPDSNNSDRIFLHSICCKCLSSIEAFSFLRSL